MSAIRRDAVKFYKQASRKIVNWKAINPSKTKNEQDFLKQTIRSELESLKAMQTDQERAERLRKISNWFDTCIHYQIPYPRPYYFPIGVSMKQARTKLF